MEEGQESWHWDSSLGPGPGTAKDIEVARRPEAGHTEHLVLEEEEETGRSQGEVVGDMHQQRMGEVEGDRQVANSPEAAEEVVVLSAYKQAHVAADCISPCWTALVAADIE